MTPACPFCLDALGCACPRCPGVGPAPAEWRDPDLAAREADDAIGRAADEMEIG